jgi:hypothetical protein
LSSSHFIILSPNLYIKLVKMLIDPAFMPWAEGKGVKLKGIEPRILPGRGIGIVAVRDIRVSQQLV